MTNFTARRQQLRALLARERCVHPGSVYDALSARIVQDLGYEVALLGGSGASLGILGSPDLSLITLTEFADLCRRICRVMTIPLFVDADSGYGNALGVMRTVEELEAAGVAGLSIEDVRLPPPYGEESGFLSPDEMVGKIKAALAARRDPALVLVARFSGLGTLGLDDTLARVKACAALGIDAVMVRGTRTKEDMQAIGKAAGLPMLGGQPSAGTGTLDDLARLGQRIALQGHAPPVAAVQAIHTALKALQDGVAPSKLPGLASAELMKKTTRAADYERWAKDFLGGD